jgi:hypothetical protein
MEQGDRLSPLLRQPGAIAVKNPLFFYSILYTETGLPIFHPQRALI